MSKEIKTILENDRQLFVDFLDEVELRVEDFDYDSRVEKKPQNLVVDADRTPITQMAFSSFNLYFDDHERSTKISLSHKILENQTNSYKLTITKSGRNCELRNKCYLSSRYWNLESFTRLFDYTRSPKFDEYLKAGSHQFLEEDTDHLSLLDKWYRVNFLAEEYLYVEPFCNYDNGNYFMILPKIHLYDLMDDNMDEDKKFEYSVLKRTIIDPAAFLYRLDYLCELTNDGFKSISQGDKIKEKTASLNDHLRKIDKKLIVDNYYA